jgi:hypothetical protein
MEGFKMDSAQIQELSFTFNCLSATGIDFYHGYQKVLTLLSNKESDDIIPEDTIIQQTQLSKEVVLLILGVLIDNGFVSHSLANSKHWYRLVNKEWEIKMTISSIADKH